jgi:uncharacterized protein
MMSHLLSLAAALTSLALVVTPAAAQNPVPAVSVSGEANVSVAPDLAQVEGGVTSEAKSAREAAEANNAAMGKVLLALKVAGIDEKDYQTSRLSLQPQYAPATPNRNTPQISGYRASNRITIKVRDITKVANVIDTLVSAGANEIGGINFIVTQASKALDEARAKAVADARRKAEIYAKAAGVTLGEPLSIIEEGAAPPPPVFRGKLAAPMAGSAPAPVAPGEEQLSIAVNVTWAIKGAQ